jgi:hypothetical protein
MGDWRPDWRLDDGLENALWLVITVMGNLVAQSVPSATPLRGKIKQITANSADEPDLYAYVRDLLIRKTFKIGLASGQVVVDSQTTISRRRPDLVVYRSEAGKPLRGPDFAAAVFEVKTDDKIDTGGKAVAKEKRSYPQAGTNWFFLIDQVVVWRIDVSCPPSAPMAQI